MLIPEPERRGPLCRGPDEEGPCSGYHPDTRATQRKPVPPSQEQVECTKESLGAQWRARSRRFVGWVLLVASAVVHLNKLVDGARALIDLISKLP